MRRRELFKMIVVGFIPTFTKRKPIVFFPESKDWGNDSRYLTDEPYRRMVQRQQCEKHFGDNRVYAWKQHAAKVQYSGLDADKVFEAVKKQAAARSRAFERMLFEDGRGV